jgi:DNA primase
LIAKRSIERVYETARIEEVVGQFVSLKRRGVNMIGLCPFHNEKTPSFTVSPSKNIFKCFGCGKGGDSVAFITEHEGYSYIESIRYLADMYRIELEEVERTDEQVQAEMRGQSLFVVNEWAKDRFASNLFSTQAGVKIGLAYFKERGFREATIKKFDLGFAPDDQKDLHKAAISIKHKPEYLKELGLVTANDNDFFRNRVMFTIHNLTGKAIGFAGRNMGDSQKQAKYINSPESEIYNKRKILYGLYFAKNEIRKLDYSILVEGYTDVISLYQAGIMNVVASSGTALTQDQVRLLKRYANHVKVLYDGDQAGIMAALRGLDVILEEGMTVKLVLLPENHDPDSYIREVGPDRFNRFIDENEKDFILFKANLLLRESKDDPIKKAVVLKDIISTLAIVRDPIMRAMYVKECSELLKIDEKIINNETNKIIKKEIRDNNLRRLREESSDTSMEVIGEKTVAPPQTFPVLDDEAQEFELLKVLMTKGDMIFNEDSGQTVMDYVLSEIADSIEYFDNEFYAYVLREISDAWGKGDFPGYKFYANHDNPEIRELYVRISITPYEYANWPGRGMELQTQLHPDKNHKKEAEQAVLRLNYEKLHKLIESLKANINDTETDSDRYSDLLEVHMKLLDRKKKLAEKLNLIIK